MSENAELHAAHALGWVQWFKNGDHPQDDCEIFTSSTTGRPFQGEGKVVRYYRDPDDDGFRNCPECGNIMHLHGWIDSALNDSGASYTVCPGDYIVQIQGNEFYPAEPSQFEAEIEATGGSPHPNLSYEEYHGLTIWGEDISAQMRFYGEEGEESEAMALKVCGDHAVLLGREDVDKLEALIQVACQRRREEE